MDVDELKSLIENSRANRVELPKHVFDRAKRRNVNTINLRDMILNGDFDEVRENNQSDPNFDYSYKVSIENENISVEMPIYFNVPGTKILVKSIWPR